MIKIKQIISVIILLTAPILVSAQTLNEAKAMYKRGEYEQSKEVFRMQLKARPNDAQLNQWYGVCLYETGEGNKAESYLQKAAKKKIQDSYLYLGKIAFDNYKFTAAKEYFRQYIEALEKNNKETSKGEYLYEKSARAESMLRRTEKVTIIDSMVVAKDNFLNNYKLSHECGSLSYYADMFKTEGEGTLYQNQRQDKVIYASITDSLYSIKERNRLNDGAWSDELELNVLPDINGNIAYPFLLNDGLTLYFATDNDSLSVGGYDIFVTRKNLNTDEYLAPNNMGMPFNSTANDYMMVIDEYHNVGWFATDRNQPSDSVVIYMFLPSTQKEIYAELEPDSIIPYAQIRSITQTWQEGADYTALINQVNTMPEKEEKKQETSFVFIIKPGVTYTQYEQFKSGKALELFKLSQSVEAEIEKQYQLLRRMRKDYASSPSKRASLKEPILKAEDYLKTLYPQPEQYRNAARAEELK